MKIPSVLFFILVATIFFSSCMVTSKTCLNNTINAPLLKQKGDVELNTFIGSSNIEIQGAYAPFEKYSFMLNFISQPDFKTNYSELAFGYFKVSLDKRKSVEFYNGFGISNRFTYYDSITFKNAFIFMRKPIGLHFEGRYIDLFSQFNYGHSLNRFFEIAVSVRIDYLYYNQYNLLQNEYHSQNASGTDLNLAENITYKKPLNVMLSKFGLSLKIGQRYVKGYVMLDLAYPLFSTDNFAGNRIYHGFNYYPLIVGGGLNVNFNVFHKRNFIAVPKKVKQRHGNTTKLPNQTFFK